MNSAERWEDDFNKFHSEIRNEELWYRQMQPAVVSDSEEEEEGVNENITSDNDVLSLPPEIWAMALDCKILLYYHYPSTV